MTEAVAETPESLKAKLLDTLVNDPKFRTRTLGLIKEFAPHVRIPELDTAAEVEARVAERLKPIETALETERTERAKDREERASQHERQIALDAGLSDDDVPEVRKLMTERGIVNFDTAVEHFSNARRVASPRSMPTPIELPSIDKDFNKAAAQPGMTALNQWARRKAYSVLNELAAGRR